MEFWRQFLVILCIAGAFVTGRVDAASVESLHIRTDIASRFATTKVTSVIRNTVAWDQEIKFNIQLPPEAFITNCTMRIDDKIYRSKVKVKAAARKQYTSAQKRGESAGLIEQLEDGKFVISVNVAANKSVKFEVTYQELLRRKLGLYENAIYLNPGQIVPEMKIDVFILESKKITELNTPVLQASDKTKRNITQSFITRVSDNEVHIGYYPSAEEQEAQFSSDRGLSHTKFIVNYDVERSLTAGEVLVVDGYFVHFIAPKGLKPIPKSIIFVLDSSGSMSGQKIAQMKEAMLAILKDLRPIDKFNIIDFDSSLKMWKKKLVSVRNKTSEEALKFMTRMSAGGSTNIGLAVQKAVEMLKTDTSGGIPMVMFLTDGQPSVGIINHDKLVNHVTGYNDFGARLMSLAFGRGADYSLLQGMSARNNGIARKIYEDADAALQLEGFYDEVSTPILAEVKVKYLSESVHNDTVTTTDFNTLFEGSEIVVSGKLSETSGPTFDLSLEGNAAEGGLVLDDTVATNTPVTQLPTSSELSSFTERLWAYLTIKQLLNARNRGYYNADWEYSETYIKDKVTRLSLKYGFVTPYTSMVVTKPEIIEEVDKESSDSPESQPKSPLKPSQGFADNDPHFVVALEGLNLPICFDVMGKDGDVFKLVSDPVSGIEVDGKVFSPHHQNTKTYFGAIIVKTKDFSVKATPKFLFVDNMKLKWRNNMMIRWHGKTIGFVGKDNLTLHVANDTDFVIMKHLRKVPKIGRVAYMGFYLNDAVGLSKQTTGVLGEFRHRTVISTDFHWSKDGQFRANLGLLNPMTSRVDVLKSKLRHRPDLEHDVALACWAVTSSVLDSDQDNYVINHKQPKNKNVVK